MPAMLIRLNKIPQISFMAAFATSLLSILDPNTNSDPSLGLEPALGSGSPSWWNQSWFYNPFCPGAARPAVRCPAAGEGPPRPPATLSCKADPGDYPAGLALP